MRERVETGMRRTLAVLVTLAAAGCVGPPPRAPADDTTEPRAADAPVPEEPAPEPVDPRGLVPPPLPAGPFGDEGDGTFLVIRRQSAEPLDSNPFVLDDGTEMIANAAMDDGRAAAAIDGTLELLGLPCAGSGGLGRIATYVPHERAERVRRLLERLPGARVLVTTPDGKQDVAYEVPPLPDDASRLHLVAVTVRPEEGDVARVEAVLREAAIPLTKLGEGDRVAFHVPTGLAREARWLLEHVPGAVRGSLEGRLQDARLVLLPAPVVRGDPDDWQSNECVCAFASLDEVSVVRAYGTLDRAGVPSIGVGNAGGDSVNVPTVELDRARRVLWATPGAQRQWREGDPMPENDHLGRHTVLWGDADPPAWVRAADAPQVELASYGHLDERWRFAVPMALFVAGIDAAGEYTWDESGEIRLRITVAEAEAESAKRLLALLDLD